MNEIQRLGFETAIDRLLDLQKTAVTFAIQHNERKRVQAEILRDQAFREIVNFVTSLASEPIEGVLDTTDPRTGLRPVAVLPIDPDGQPKRAYFHQFYTDPDSELYAAVEYEGGIMGDVAFNRICFMDVPEPVVRFVEEDA